jgi:hypothetical protein
MGVGIQLYGYEFKLMVKTTPLRICLGTDEK